MPLFFHCTSYPSADILQLSKTVCFAKSYFCLQWNTAFKNQPEENIDDVGLLILIYIFKKYSLKKSSKNPKNGFSQKWRKLNLVLFTGGKKPKQKQKKERICWGKSWFERLECTCKGVSRNELWKEQSQFWKFSL